MLQCARVAQSDVQGQRHAQVEEYVHQRCPGRGRVVLVHRFLGGLQVVHDLPDPGGDAKGAAHERQCGIEYLPAGMSKGRPALLHVGHRLAGCQFDQGIGIGLEQRGQCVIAHFFIGQRDRAAHVQHGQGLDQRTHHRPRRRQGVGKHVLGVIEPLCLGQPGQNRFAQRSFMFDGVQQVLPRRKLQQRRFKQGPIEHAGASVGLSWADHEHIGGPVLFMPRAQGGHERQAADDDRLPVHLALMFLGTHNRGDIPVTAFIDTALLANLHLQGQQRQLHLQVAGVELLSSAGLLRVLEEFLFDQGRVVLANIDVFDYVFQVAVGQPVGYAVVLAVVVHRGIAGGQAGEVLQGQVDQAATGNVHGIGDDKGAPQDRALDDDLDLVQVQVRVLFRGTDAALQLGSRIVTNGWNAVLERLALVVGVQVGQVDQVAAVGGGIGV